MGRDSTPGGIRAQDVASSVAIGAIWGFTYVAVKWGLRDTGPMTLGLLRVVLGAVTLLVLAGALSGPMPRSPRLHGQLAAIGLLGVAVFIALLNIGTARVNAGTAALIVYSQPLVLAVLAPLVLHERISKVQVAGVLLGMLGLLLVVFSRLAGGGSWIGYAALLGCALSWSLSTVVFKKVAPEVSLLWGVALQVAYSIPPLLLASVLAEGVQVHVTVRLAVIAVFLGAGASGLAYLLWFNLLGGASALVASVSVLLVPLFAALFGAVILGEHWSIVSAIGALCIIGSIALVYRAPGGKTEEVLLPVPSGD